MIEHAASGKLFSRTPVWRFCYWGGVAALFALAVWQRFSLPLEPIADPDTWGYLSPALRKLTGAEFGHTYGRNFLYPGFLFVLLRVVGDFRVIAIAQHLLGLMAGGILILVWRRARVFVPNPRLGRPAFDALGLLAAAIYLLASDPTRTETQIRPEGVCGFLIAINIYAVVQFIGCTFMEGRRRAATASGIAVVLTSILLASAKPSFVLAAFVAVVPVGIFFFRRDWLWQKVALATGAMACAALLLLPEHFLSRNDEDSRTFLPTTLFVVHADLIRDQMSQDIEQHANVPYTRDWLERIRDALKDEIAKSHAARPRHYSSLGFDPDYLMYYPGSIARQLRQEFSDNASLCAFYRYYYARTWRERPLLALKKVARQMVRFYKPVCPAYNRRKSWPLIDVYQRSMLALEPGRRVWGAYAPAVEFMRKTETLSRNAPMVRQIRVVRVLLALPALTYLPLLLSALVLCPIVWLRTGWRKRLGGLAALVWFGYSYNLAACLEVAIINSLDVGRYITVQLFLVILAQFLALWFVLEFILEARLGAKMSRRAFDS